MIKEVYGAHNQTYDIRTGPLRTGVMPMSIQANVGPGPVG